MEQIIQRLLENHLSELEGLIVDATIPIPEPLINELVAASLAGNKKVTYVHISIGEQNRMDVQVKTPLVPWQINLKLKLFRSVELTGSPKLRAFLENNLLLGKLGSLFNALPDGIFLYDDQISIDLGKFLPSPDLRQLLDLVKEMDVRTSPGKLIIDVKLEK